MYKNEPLIEENIPRTHAKDQIPDKIKSLYKECFLSILNPDEYGTLSIVLSPIVDKDTLILLTHYSDIIYHNESLRWLDGDIGHEVLRVCCRRWLAIRNAIELRLKELRKEMKL